MTNNIPPELLLAQDMVVIFDHGPADEPNDPPVELRMHATDAKHAMDVEPERYTLDLEPRRPRQDPPKLTLVEPEPVHVDEPVTDFGTEDHQV